MGIKPIYPSLIHDNNPICSLDTGNPLGNDQLGRTRDFLSKSFSDPGIRSRIHRAGRIIQDQDLRFLQKSTGNAESLLLSSRHIRSALLDIRMVPLRETPDKFIGTVPAVCGLPKEEAYRFILDNEGYDRRYYSGFIGWLDPDGKTDLYVNLRCMHIENGQLSFYAGGGLLASSDLNDEWLETEKKLQTMKRLVNMSL